MMLFFLSLAGLSGVLARGRSPVASPDSGILHSVKGMHRLLVDWVVSVDGLAWPTYA